MARDHEPMPRLPPVTRAVFPGKPNKAMVSALM
jgi:hypothetical protein